MVSMPIRRATRVGPTGAESRRAPIEGWGTIVLHAALLVFMAESIARIERSDRVSILIPLALGGGALGFVLAKARTFDLLAHLTALVFGITAALLATCYHYGDFGGGWREALDNIETRSERFIDAFAQSKPLDDDLLVATIGITLWLVAYCSAWMLYRRRWLGPAVMLPGFVILTSLGLDRDASANPVYAYLAVAMVLAARHFAFRRQQDWQRLRLAPPPALPGRFLQSGILVAVIALAIGITLPVEAPDDVIDNVSQHATRGWEQLQKQWERLPLTKRDGDGAGNYAEFPDEFKIGSPIDLSDDPVAILQSNSGQSEYLAARRYNVYDGHSWLSDVDATFRFPSDAKDLSVTPATFIPSQQVPLSPGFRRDREENTGFISVLREKGQLLLTIDSYYSSSEATTVIMGWRKLDDEAIPVARVGADTSPDLYALLALLQQAQFTPSPSGGEPTVTDPNLSAQIAAMRQTLRNDYPVQTKLELVNGEVVLHVTGRLPIYDDIEVVYSSDGKASSSQYQVSGLESDASPDDLRRANSEYAQYIRDRYLGLPTSVTERTRQLATDVTANASNPFDQAIAIQEFLRTTYPYTLNTPMPPDNEDFVDNFLFETQTGRCEQFATAMVVMLRTLGVPARLVSGYSPADYDPSVNGFLYREKQAHTWVEAFFPGFGWIPFEPTPSQTELDYGADQDTPPANPTPTPTPMPTPAPTVTPTAAPDVQATPSPVAAPISSDSGDDPFYQRLLDRLPLVPTIIVIVVFTAGLGLALAWLWGLRGLSPGAGLYARALRIARFWGVQPNPTLTPVEFASEVDRAVPGTRGAMRAVAEIYSAEQYGPPGFSTARTSSGRMAWRELRGSLLRWRPWRKRPRYASEHQETAGD